MAIALAELAKNLLAATAGTRPVARCGSSAASPSLGRVGPPSADLLPTPCTHLLRRRSGPIRVPPADGLPLAVACDS
jgi:hypothetical protein